MATYPKLVNKQFNSPIKLYSPQNVQETLNKQTQLLANGAVGIDFMHNKNVDKPGNLANSAVLRMLEEEEERQRKGQPPSLKRVAWPPPAEPDHQSGTPILEQEPVFAQTQPPNYSTSPQQQQYQPQPTQAFRPVAASAQPPPPSTIQLRQEVPVTQQPNPVFPSQPATATLQGGTNMRGDQKWPPAEVKAAVAAENEARMQLAKGPACRPRKVKKDYSQFFAQHALNATYPGYRAPPGTQHYEDNSGMSSL